MITQSNRIEASTSMWRMRGEVSAPIGLGSGRPAGASISVSDSWNSGSLCSPVAFSVSPKPFAFEHLRDLVQRRPAQIGIDQQHLPLVRLAERQRQVDRGRGLAFARLGARDHQHADVAGRLRLVQRRGELPELLDQQTVRVLRRSPAAAARRR